MKWYQFDMRELNKAEYQMWYSLMNESHRARVDRLRLSDDKKRTVAGEMLARRAIAELCGVSAESIRFDRTEFGKPFAVDLPVEFNISHSGYTVVCAVSDIPVGIDVEVIRPVDLSIARRIYTEEDLKYLFGHIADDDEFVKTDNHDLLLRFFELWTAKEAYFKCLGIGIVEPKMVSYSCICKGSLFRQIVSHDVVVAIWQNG